MVGRQAGHWLSTPRALSSTCPCPHGDCVWPVLVCLQEKVSGIQVDGSLYMILSSFLHLRSVCM